MTQKHIGQYVREQIIPKSVTVTEAARRLGVSRATLSNLLNGHSSLSNDMIMRLEKTFRADRQKLLVLVAASNSDEMLSAQKEISVVRHVNPFLTIKAADIQEWSAHRLIARQLVAVLLRKLILSTTSNIEKIDFPGYDNSERKGWDGETVSQEATPWVPLGHTIWEAGVGDAAKKAASDYKKKTENTDAAIRRNLNYVFVTTQNWPNKEKWVRQCLDARQWKSVRAYDASDLEQWLEQSYSTQAWLAKEMGRDAFGVETVEKFWDEWRLATTPEMTPELFRPSAERHVPNFVSWIEEGSNRPLVITADSKLEALAFLWCLLGEAEKQGRNYRERCMVFTRIEGVGIQAWNSDEFLYVANDDDIEKAFAIHPKAKLITFKPRAIADRTSHIAVDLLSSKEFSDALKMMGFSEDEIDKKSYESGRSPTILRRQLSRLPAVSAPAWSRERVLKIELLPIALAGAWRVGSKADEKILEKLAGQSYSEIERALADMLGIEDVPVWSVGAYRGVISKLDALFSIRDQFTSKNIDDFFEVAENVLSEEDPALQVSADERWWKSPRREHSESLRKGICETLTLFSIHGDQLFGSRFGFNVSDRVVLLIRKLLTPLSFEKLFNHQSDLPSYAEAAPDEFIRIIEKELEAPNSVLATFMRPESQNLLGSSCPRSGLLWALESLAWKPSQMRKVSLILAKLSEERLDDNWSNKPENSLGAIFRSWMPQTAASLEQRQTALKTICRKFPAVGWKLCLEQFGADSRMGSHSHKPKWRNDASGFGEPLKTYQEIIPFNNFAFELALNWDRYDAEMLGNLFRVYLGLPAEFQKRIISVSTNWALQTNNEDERIQLKETIRRSVFTRRAKVSRGVNSNHQELEALLSLLSSSDLVKKHQWLFLNHWVEESWDEVHSDEIDYQEREARIRNLRAEAISEIWQSRGLDGIWALTLGGDAAFPIGFTLSTILSNIDEKVIVIENLISLQGDMGRSNSLIHGVLLSSHVSDQVKILEVLSERLSDTEYQRVLKLAPFESHIWNLISSQGTHFEEAYWNEVSPGWVRNEPGEISEAVRYMLRYGRPRDLFNAVHLYLESVEPKDLKLILEGMLVSEETRSFQTEDYSISKALDILQRTGGASVDELARLEFSFLEILERSEHGIPNLKRIVFQSPLFLFQLMAVAYKRSDDAEDPEELGIADLKDNKSVHHKAYLLLHHMDLISDNLLVDHAPPGEKRMTLQKWVDELRLLGQKYARLDMTDQSIGQILARTAEDGSGIWPPKEVCEVMESIATDDFSTGFSIGKYNARGAHWRGSGGEQERELADKYRSLAANFAVEYPFVASVLEDLAKSYDRDAKYHDVETSVNHRLRGW